MIQQIVKLISLMHSGKDPREIALSFALGMIPGLTPVKSLHNLAVVLLLLIFRTNISAALLSWVFFSAVSFGLDPLFHRLGLFLLVDLSLLRPFWTYLYNMPIVPYTRFNNSVVMGSLVFSLLIFYPVYWVSKRMVIKYRETVMERLNRLRIVQLFRASKIYGWYTRYQKLSGG